MIDAAQRALALGTALALAALVACGGDTRPRNLLVFAAASTTEALTELGTAYTEQTGVEVHCAFGASSALARQLLSGVPADVFLSADREHMNELERVGLVSAGDRFNLLANELAVVVPAGSDLVLRTPEDLLAAGRIAIADPEAVPAGMYAEEWLSANGLWAALEPRLIPTADVRAALAAVESANADAGIVYRTDALSSRRTRLALAVPAAGGPRIMYPVAVLRSSRQPAAARAFVTFLRSEEARAVFARLGFIPILSS